MARVTEADRREAEAVLPPSARLWFRSLPRDLQWHGLQVMRDLKRAGIDHAAVLAAALLHDAGKAEAASGPIQRATIVLTRHLTPGWVTRRSAIDWRSARGLERMVAVAQQHPQIAADIAQHYGCDPITIDLIRRHQDRTGADDPMLRALQQVDDRN
jgi:putative nucleotidyltransferase with HDIG domain